MKRVKLVVAYEGTNYCGWQIQPKAITVEKVLNDALSQLTGENIKIIGASRTDAGVHAYGNVAVFDTESTIPGDRFSYAVNRLLPDDVVVQNSCEVKCDFHPRYCDTIKTYEYKILNTTFWIPQMRNFVWHWPHKLNVEDMQYAANALVGEHDFKSFCSVKTEAKSTVRTIYSVEVMREKPESDIIIVRIRGNGFLYNMVRIIAGTLGQVGAGQVSKERVQAILESCDRQAAGLTAPPQGLTLVEIKYP